MIVPTGGDIDASLRSLRVEFNDLDKQTTTTQVDRGKRLIAVRQLLELKNGRSKQGGSHAADGLRPAGWKEWVKENLTIGTAQAATCIRYAINPANKASSQASTNRSRGAKSFRTFKSAWARYPNEMKRQIAEFVIAEVRKEQAQ